MQGMTLDELRELLQQVRGETRIKVKEESIRNRFIQTAADEIFQENDWTFNARTEIVEIDDEGKYSVPANFSAMNSYWAIGANAFVYGRDAFELHLEDNGTILLSGPTEATLELHYYRVAPNLIAKPSETKLYFPDFMLVAERAYVRLKTAYFPDQNSEKEYAQSRKVIRELYTRSVPRPKFTHKALK